MTLSRKLVLAGGLAAFALPSGGAQSASAPAPDAPAIVRLDPALDRLIAPGAVPVVLADGFQFTEGPMWRAGRLWFVDEEGDRIHAVTPEGELSTLIDYPHSPWAAPTGSKVGPNAMACAADGSVVAMQQYARDVVHLIDDPKNPQVPVCQTPFFDSYDGKHLNSPNDLVFLPDGSFFFTDPPYGLKGRDHDPAKQLPFNGVFHVKDGKLTPVITDLPYPNGVALSPDHRTLYVNNSGPNQRVIAYPLHPDGSVGPAHDVLTFTGKEGPGVPDGLKVDSLGDLWTTGPGGIRIVTPAGRVLGQIKLPQVAANLGWGGNDGRTLFITAGSHVYKLHVLVAGSLPAFCR